MPEGPEVRREADRIGAVLVGQRLEAVTLTPAALRRHAAGLVGREVVTVTSRGKAMLIGFDDGRTLYSHNQLYGRWMVSRRGSLPATRRSLRVALHTALGSALLYSASSIELLDADGLVQHPFLARLGPDALDPALTWPALERRLVLPVFSKRSLGSLYLDQGFLAGIGNYLRSEILFFARLDPARRPAELTRTERQRLARQSLSITRRAYATGGITNPPARVARLRREGLRRGVYRFAVFGRDGRPCHDCGTVIERRTVASRRLYVCPRCQGGA
ncbi:MAG: endonuclease VIII [Gammaproteobacteria bacterium]|nr:endonuclease VIII [Gammaproteobacteria bacterium]MCP5201484.1 endonuclease VIII [Gammaproteobacteria bacterium]